MLLREGVVGQRLLDPRLDELGGPGQPQRRRLLPFGLRWLSLVIDEA